MVLLSPWRDAVVSELPDLQLGCASVLAVSASTLFVACIIQFGSLRGAEGGVSRVFHTFGSGLDGARYQLKPYSSHLPVFQQLDVQASLSRPRSLAVARARARIAHVEACERCAADSNIVAAVTACSSSIERCTPCGMQHDSTR